jgi:adenylate cyclase
LRSVLGGVTSPRRLAALLVSAIAATVGTVLFLGVSAWWVWPATKLSPAPEVTAASSTPQPLVAPRLSIVVLPFDNLSEDPDQQYFADGMTDDLTTDLSRITDMFVIARNTAFTYRNKPFTAKQIGRELGVRYVLEGSVQRSGNRARINSQLIDAETEAHLWAERFEGDTCDLFALQNEVTTRIAVALKETIPLVERAIRLSPRDPERGVWYENIGLVHLLQSRTDEAIIWLERPATTRRHTLSFAVISPPLMASLVRPSAPRPNSPKPGG